MVVSCSAYNCTSRQAPKDDLSEGKKFHRFPMNKPALLQLWVKAVRREGWQPTKFSFLCEDHFTDDDYKSPAKKYLKHNAVPSKFSFPSHLQKEMKKRRAIIKHSIINKKRKVNEIDCEDELVVSANCNDEQAPGPSTLSHSHIEPVETVLSNSSNKETQTSNFTANKQTQTAKFCQSPTKQKLRMKIKLLQQKLRRRNSKVHNLSALLDQKKQKYNISDDVLTVLKENFGEIPFELLKNELRNQSCKPSARRYSPTIKDFAVTVYFYSPKTYKFIRKKCLNLPHPAVIRSWLLSVNCEPGFLDVAFSFLQEKLKQPENAYLSDMALIVDSMSLRKQIIWDKARNKFSGYVECCGLIDDKKNLLASEALVLMVVSMTKRFKCPIAYFYTDKISSHVLARVLEICIRKLNNIGVNVCSVTADGAAYNVQAFQILGCKLTSCYNYANLLTHFPHPVTNFPVYVFLDPCHMLKLARNALAEKHLSTTNGKISWRYIVELEKLQQDIGFKFANKISGAHINYQNKKMNVSLSAQTLSSSTADAIEFLMKTENKHFQGAEETIKFIRIIDRLFDLLNSRNPFAKGYKQPLSLQNKFWWERVFNETTLFLENLNVDDLQILKTPRKMFALGFLISIKSMRSLCSHLLQKNQNPQKYVLSYKISQDHIELFFGSIRSCGGFNNNPNTMQFMWALRKLLVSKTLQSNNGNCITFDESDNYSIFEFRSQKRSVKDVEFSDEDNLYMSYYSEILNTEHLSHYSVNILHYISGYIVKNISKRCSCNMCIGMITENANDSDHIYSKKTPENPKSFTSMISRGGLAMCSKTVLDIVCAAERAFRVMALKNEINKINLNAMILRTTSEYLSDNGIKFNHPINNEIGCERLHETQMTKQIINLYLNIRLMSYAKNYTIKTVHSNSSTLRQKLSKIILFKNV